VPEIKLYTLRYLPEDVVDGDIRSEDRDEETLTFDPEDFEEGDAHTAALWAAKELRDRGLTEYSASGFQGQRGWYSLADGSQPSGWDGHYTGRLEQVTAHLEGFTDAEVERVYRAVAER
jgi:hypothetical protein